MRALNELLIIDVTTTRQAEIRRHDAHTSREHEPLLRVAVMKVSA
jgi:hypothetical protein